jgi:hypothetical protein
VLDSPDQEAEQDKSSLAVEPGDAEH